MDIAIWARGVCKTYGGKNGTPVLDNLDMTVKKGTIYGLLGASGCGKTTLLSTLVGCRPINSGKISVLGRPPSTSKNQAIGYMPQDISLVGEFTVKGAIFHFGWLFGIADQELEERFKFLNTLLDLPPSNRMVKNLSGGQQRRVSLAVALVHNPEMLILDEPTVGLDPVLRQSIWDYLVQLTQENKTIIITTHYIEEAGQAHTVGLMRNGKLLSEGTPSSLMTKYNCNNIEDVFLLLSRKQHEGELNSINSEEIQLFESACTIETAHGEIQLMEETSSTLVEKIKKIVCFTNYNHTKALVTKNVYKLTRNKASLVFCYMFPLIQMALFLITIGGDPTSLQFGVVNPEIAPYQNCHAYANNNVIGGKCDPDQPHCNYTGLSCKYLLGLPEQLSHNIYFHNTSAARKAAKEGTITGYFEFHENYSVLLGKFKENVALTAEEVDQVQIVVDMDRSNYPITIYVEGHLLDRFNDFSQEIEKDCGFNPKIGAIPIRKMDAVYSSYDARFSEFMAPGYMLTVSVFLALSVSALSVVTERLDGSWDRTLVSGVTTTEIVVFHFIVMSIVNFFQNVMLFVITFVIFGVECRGSLLTVMLLITLQGISGTAMGTLVSVVSNSVSECILISLGMFYPFLVLSGICWPLEAMPYLLRILSYYLVPTTISVEAMANTMNRGWSILNFNVAKGIYSSIGWTILLNILNITILKKKDSS